MSNVSQLNITIGSYECKHPWLNLKQILNKLNYFFNWWKILLLLLSNCDYNEYITLYNVAVWSQSSSLIHAVYAVVIRRRVPKGQDRRALGKHVAHDQTKLLVPAPKHHLSLLETPILMHSSPDKIWNRQGTCISPSNKDKLRLYILGWHVAFGVIDLNRIYRLLVFKNYCFECSSVAE